MSKTLAETQRTDVHAADVVHHGEQITLPEGMDIDDAIDVLQRRKDYLEQPTELHRAFDAFPWDGAAALKRALETVFGWAQATFSPGLFGPEPPKMITVATGPKTSIEVPWGMFSLPGIDGHVSTGVSRRKGRFVFEMHAKVRKKDEPLIERVAEEVGRELRESSIYLGKAIKIRFRDEDGSMVKMPEPEFIDVSGTSRDDMVFSEDVASAIEHNLFTPIERVEDCEANNIAVKRGVLLGGPYGCGKTMAAMVAARLATDNGVTYLYVPRADELGDAIEFAKQYQSKACVVFCEDIDRAMSGERSVAMDDVLNILDGIDTKSSNIITVLTTNHLNEITPAMLRPGRLDAVINVTPPDAEAAEQLIRVYGDGRIPEDEDLSEAGQLLDGAIPAVIAEVVRRAKLVQMAKQQPGEEVRHISGDAVAAAAKTIQEQVTLLDRQSNPTEREPTFNEVMGGAVRWALEQDEA